MNQLESPIFTASTKRILIAGAGHGGIIAGMRLAQAGYQVHVFERSTVSHISWEWHDDMDRYVFESLNMGFNYQSLLEPKDYFLKENWTFITPNQQTSITINIKDAEKDISVSRRALVQNLISKAKEMGVKFHFKTEIIGPYIKDDRVHGIIISSVDEGDETEIVEADLVIDAAGINSPLRNNLPTDYNIKKGWNRGDVFYAYRAFYDLNTGNFPLPPSPKSKVYLKHLGRTGISWAIWDPHNMMNVLVGSIDPLTPEFIETALTDLRKSNPLIGEHIMLGGIQAIIPVRHPLELMVGNNYAAIGDSAFMTIPLMGSGIASSLVAGRCLADTIITQQLEIFADFTIDHLWQYQVAFYHQIGAQLASVDVMKTFLLYSENEDLDFLLAKGIITKDDLRIIARGENVRLPLFNLIERLFLGIERVGLLLKIKFLLDKAQRVKKIALKIPTCYDNLAVLKWQKTFQKLFFS